MKTGTSSAMGGYIICRQDDYNTFAGIVIVKGGSNFINTLFTRKIYTLLPTPKPNTKCQFWSVYNTEIDGI